jgi:hypothetical protein
MEKNDVKRKTVAKLPILLDLRIVCTGVSSMFFNWHASCILPQKRPVRGQAKTKEDTICVNGKFWFL